MVTSFNEEDLGLIKTTQNGERGFTKRKRLHKISLEVWEIVEELHTCSSPFDIVIWE